MQRFVAVTGLVLVLATAGLAAPPGNSRDFLKWTPLPSLPDELGVAGPIVGTHRGALIVAGGANFPRPVWDHDKVWHDQAWVLIAEGVTPDKLTWLDGFALDRPRAYAACVSTPHGIAVLGGNDGPHVYQDCYLLQWNPTSRQLAQTPLPDLPEPCTYGSATMIGQTIYLAGGQRDAGLDSAMKNFWRLDLTALNTPGRNLAWEELPAWPGPARAFNLTVAQHNGFESCVYVMSGRRQVTDQNGKPHREFLTDVYEFTPSRQTWRKRANVPKCVMAGTAAAIGQSHIFVLSGADGSLMSRADDLKLEHPGFPRQTWAYHTITDTWVKAGPSPANQVTTPAVRWQGRVVVASGEVKPRVRTTDMWAVEPIATERPFGWIDLSVLGLYLLGMVGVGWHFSSRNKNTDDFFRGGKQVAWWAAGCSIFATMLSSVTFMAIPAKAFAQDQVYLLGNLMIVAVAPIAIYLAMPFFRRIDATSAYEYLEKRFNRPVRLFASASFTLFHVFRMGIVMSLAALALSIVTPLSAPQCVLVMGVLSIIYCTMGGVEAVIWTDTIQTMVLLGGAILCLGMMLAGTGDSVGESLNTAWGAGKLHVANFHWDASSASLALWVVVIGAIGQNISSYTADQAVVQRYVTTPDSRRAARSIWVAALVAIPASLLFFGIGTALFLFYKAHPEKLDPTFMTDQIFPLFIAREVPVGLAGLIVAGIFAAAQSTVSSSMNSTATTIVTDFLRPFNVLSSERAYLASARSLTVAIGITGTALGLLFVNPQIKSLFDQFIKIIGLFMGVLGGLFALGILTTRATGWGTLVGAVGGAAVMMLLPIFTQINGYLYAAIGLTSCFAIGYLASLLLPTRRPVDPTLTIYGQTEPSTTLGQAVAE